MEAPLKFRYERGRVERLADRGVVDVAVLLEIGGQVILGVAPAVRADDEISRRRIASRNERSTHNS